MSCIKSSCVFRMQPSFRPEEGALAVSQGFGVNCGIHTFLSFFLPLCLSIYLPMPISMSISISMFIPSCFFFHSSLIPIPISIPIRTSITITILHIYIYVGTRTTRKHVSTSSGPCFRALGFSISGLRLIRDPEEGRRPVLKLRKLGFRAFCLKCSGPVS